MMGTGGTIMKDYQHVLPTMDKGMTPAETALFERKVTEWADKGYQVLFADLHEGVGCLLYRPKPMSGTQTIQKLDEFRGQGATPLKALQSAAATLGKEALFG